MDEVLLKEPGGKNFNVRFVRGHDERFFAAFQDFQFIHQT